MVQRIDVSDGKYTVLLPEKEGEKFEALRYGEPWRSLLGDKFVYCLAFELDESRKRIVELEHEIKDLEDYLDESKRRIRNAEYKIEDMYYEMREQDD